MNHSGFSCNSISRYNALLHAVLRSFLHQHNQSSDIYQRTTLHSFTANIIVAEKVARLDPNSAMDFFRHYKVCFWITLVSCATGALVITLEFQLERLIMGN